MAGRFFFALSRGEDLEDPGEQRSIPTIDRLGIMFSPFMSANILRQNNDAPRSRGRSSANTRTDSGIEMIRTSGGVEKKFDKGLRRFYVPENSEFKL